MASLDLYDHEIVAATQAMVRINEWSKFSRNTQQNLRDLAQRIADEFHKIGLLVHVDVSACTVVNPKTGRTYPPDVEIVGRIADPFSQKEFDHEEKKFEVIDSKIKGEKYRGLKEPVNKKK